MATAAVAQRCGIPGAPGDIAREIREYVRACARPMLAEAGIPPFAVTPDNFELLERGNHVVLHIWSDSVNLSRRITGIASRRRDAVTLRTEVFGGRAGAITMYDAGRPSTCNHDRRSARLELRERFRRFLRRQFPNMKLSVLSTAANLESTLSPNFPRALLRHGTTAWAAIAAPAEPSIVDEVLSFGLIWLDYLRRRESRSTVEGLTLYLPAGLERTTCLRLQYLSGAKWSAWAYAEEGFESQLDLRDYGNLNSSVAICRCRVPGASDALIAPVLAIPGVEGVAGPDGSLRIRVRGVEIGRVGDNGILWTFDSCAPHACSVEELEPLARELARVRAHDTSDRRNPLYLRDSELWLESQVRAHIEDVDAHILPGPVYRQVPGITGTAHGVIDLLALRRDGRLVVMELKASEDVHLPLQALDYWMRVKWHAEQGDFSRNGYFAGEQIRLEAPTLLLVAPAQRFHPSNEVVLRYFSPEIRVERIGVGIEWQKKLKLTLRA